MPVRSFWSFYANIFAIRAEEDLRALDIALASNGGEYATDLRSRLVELMGDPIKENPLAEPSAEEVQSEIAKLRLARHGMSVG